MKSLLVAVLMAGLVFVGSASANGPSQRARPAALSFITATPQLVCQVYPYPSAPTSYCSGPVPSGSYTATFNILNLPAGNYAYSWDVPHVLGGRVADGCTTAANCTVAFSANGNDYLQTVTATVTDIATGQQYVLSATIDQGATCHGAPGFSGYYWC